MAILGHEQVCENLRALRESKLLRQSLIQFNSSGIFLLQLNYQYIKSKSQKILKKSYFPIRVKLFTGVILMKPVNN